MEILKKARKIVACGILGAGAGTLMGITVNTFIEETPAEVEADIRKLEDKQDSLGTKENTVERELGAACFKILEGVFEGGMGLDQAVADAVTNPDTTVCGNDTEEVLDAVHKVSYVEAEIDAVEMQLSYAQVDLDNANNGAKRIAAFGALFSAASAMLCASGMRRQ